ncbi:MAG: hypothetical protein MET45_29025 [Nostoc sp. LLA-1]|nr:hypothetical protein [Cyanocohniella sp. LLY]
MSQHPLIDSGTSSSPSSGLKPALAAALASLEVPLDQELARYRRTRIALRIPNQYREGNYISQSQDLTDTTATEEQNSPYVGEVNSHTPAGFVFNESPQETAKTEELNHLNLSANTESINTQIPQSSVNSGSSIVPAIAKTNSSENLAQTNDTPSQPDDYLESSEALLRSLTDEQQQPVQKPSHSNDSLLSPLGIGSMLLLLVASLTLGYIVFNPNSQDWPEFNFGRLFNSDPSASTDSTEAVGNSTQPVQPELTPIPKYPNLAAQEFPEVRDPTDIVGLQPKVQPTVTPQPPPQPVVPPVVESLPELQPAPPVNLPAIPTVQPSPETTPTPPTSNTELKPAADGFYHVVMDNQGDGALTAARKVVPDAYLSPGQTVIYLGSVKTPEAAKQRVQELQSQGLKARIQQP